MKNKAKATCPKSKLIPIHKLTALPKDFDTRLPESPKLCSSPLNEIITSSNIFRSSINSKHEKIIIKKMIPLTTLRMDLDVKKFEEYLP